MFVLLSFMTAVLHYKWELFPCNLWLRLLATCRPLWSLHVWEQPAKTHKISKFGKTPCEKWRDCNWRAGGINCLCQILGRFSILLKTGCNFACGLELNLKTLPLTVFLWLAVYFREITYAKNQSAPSVKTRKQKIALVFLKQWNQWIMVIKGLLQWLYIVHIFLRSITILLQWVPKAKWFEMIPDLPSLLHSPLNLCEWFEPSEWAATKESPELLIIIIVHKQTGI